MIGRGRIIPRDAMPAVACPMAHESAPTRLGARRLPREVIEAHEQAERMVLKAQSEAAALLLQARQTIEAERATTAERARADAAAEVATLMLRLSQAEREQDERSLARSVELSRVLAERLLREQLRLEPATVAALARAALLEARAARRARLAVHPADVAWMEQALGPVGLDVELVADPSRLRGEFTIETELGTLDATLGPQLDRLVSKLNESLNR